MKRFRRILVFLLGGFICPACKDAEVIFDTRFIPCKVCRSCGKFFMTIKWLPRASASSARAVWRGHR